MPYRMTAFILSFMIHLGFGVHYPLIHSASSMVSLPTGHTRVEISFVQERESINLQSMHTDVFETSIEKLNGTYDRVRNNIKNVIRLQAQIIQTEKIDSPQPIQINDMPKPKGSIARTAINVRLNHLMDEGVNQSKLRYKMNPPPVYPRSALIRNIEGEVRLLVEIDEKGFPTSVTVEHSSGFQILDQAAQKAVWHWEFEPAKDSNLYINSRVRIPICFRIDRSGIS